jgi:hypothetical protein
MAAGLGSFANALMSERIYIYHGKANARLFQHSTFPGYPAEF